MSTGYNQQALSYDLRLPDEAQEDALRLLAASRTVVNTALSLLWLRLDEFAGVREGPAWKQVTERISSPAPHGNRQWRCEAETVGRILRGQAERKQLFERIQPILTDGFIRPKNEKRPAGKQRPTIKAAIDLFLKRSTAEGDEESYALVLNVVEQCCNFFLREGHFPRTYEELQPTPLLKMGLLAFAGDDGPSMGQSYKLSLNEEATQAELLFRYPDEQGVWQWRKAPTILTIPDIVREHLTAGKRMAPTLREHVCPDGSHIAALDFTVQVKKAELADWKAVERVIGFDWGVHTLLTISVLNEQYQQVSRPWFVQTDGFDAKQARTRRQIDQLKARQDQLPPDHPKQAIIEREIVQCWRKYEARNHELGHLAANVILLLASVYQCQLISGESLSTLKTIGRGKGAKGRWRNWKNNTTIRSEIWKILRYKAHLVGIRFRSEHPRGTSHTCPRCHEPARTFRSPRPEHRKIPIDWGRWLICEHCGYSADRDYCASLNIASLGVAYLLQVQQSRKAWSFKMADPVVKSSRYIPEGAVLLLPPPTRTRSRSHEGEKTRCYPGWTQAVVLCSSYPMAVIWQLCGVG